MGGGLACAMTNCRVERHYKKTRRYNLCTRWYSKPRFQFRAADDDTGFRHSSNANGCLTDDPSNSWWTEQFIKLLILRCAPSICHLLYLRSKCLTQQPLLSLPLQFGLTVPRPKVLNGTNEERRMIINGSIWKFWSRRSWLMYVKDSRLQHVKTPWKT